MKQTFNCRTIITTSQQSLVLHKPLSVIAHHHHQQQQQQQQQQNGRNFMKTSIHCDVLDASVVTLERKKHIPKR